MPRTPTPICELGCYVDLNGSFYEVPRLDVEQNFRWELMAQSVDLIYPLLFVNLFYFIQYS